MDKLILSILKTISYYDCFDWPLTALEIWKYLAKGSRQQPANGNLSITLGDIMAALESDEVKELVAKKYGFYFLKDREGDNLPEKRVEAEKLTDMKWKILRRRAKWMAIIPYVRLVMASGSIAMGRVEDSSDFDTFIVAKSGRIWTARFFLTVFLDILGWRRRGKVTKNRFCLNHYITDQSLTLESRNVSTAMGYYGRLIPIMGDLELFKKFIDENKWLGEYLEQYPQNFDTLTQRYVRPAGAFLAVRRLLEFLLNPIWGDWLENALRAVQLEKIKRNPLTASSQGQVIASNKELRFHPGPQEQNILRKYHQRLALLDIKEEAQTAPVPFQD